MVGSIKKETLDILGYFGEVFIVDLIFWFSIFLRWFVRVISRSIFEGILKFNPARSARWIDGMEKRRDRR